MKITERREKIITMFTKMFEAAKLISESDNAITLFNQLLIQIYNDLEACSSLEEAKASRELIIFLLCASLAYRNGQDLDSMDLENIVKRYT